MKKRVIGITVIVAVVAIIVLIILQKRAVPAPEEGDGIDLVEMPAPQPRQPDDMPVEAVEEAAAPADSTVAE